LRCKLKLKDDDKNLPTNEIRFESDTIQEGASKLDELVVMDTVAYVLMRKKEFVFIRGSIFNESSSIKEYT